MKPNKRRKVLRSMARCFGYSVNTMLTFEEIQEKVPSICKDDVQELVAGAFLYAYYESSGTKYSAEPLLFESVSQELSASSSMRVDRWALAVAILSLIVAVVSVLVQFV